MIKINSFDIDGVINMGQYNGIYPGPLDIIITGRSLFDEWDETLILLEKKGIKNNVFANPVKFDEKTRVGSGLFKAKIINEYYERGVLIELHFDDDPIQIEQIQLNCPQTKCVLISHDLVEKENVRHKNYE